MNAHKAGPPTFPLATLLAGWLASESAGDLAVSGLCNDSRLAQPGDLFLAVPGRRTSGARHLEQAIAAGVAGVLIDASVPLPTGLPVPVLALADLAARQGIIAARFTASRPRR